MKIQFYVRMQRVNFFLNVHDPQHPDHLKVFEILKKIYKNAFSLQNRIPVCSKLIRHLLLFNNDMKSIAPHFTIFQEASTIINSTKFYGTILIPAKTWALLCRYTFYINSVSSLTVKVHLFSNISHYTIKIFNNTTGKELNKTKNCEYIGTFENNIDGYTAVCYGWTRFN